MAGFKIHLWYYICEETKLLVFTAMWERAPQYIIEHNIRVIYSIGGASLIAQLVKNPPVIQETPVRFLGWEDSPGEGKGYSLQYSGLENSMDCIVHVIQRVGHNSL